jgi:hypothetical protein
MCLFSYIPSCCLLHSGFNSSIVIRNLFSFIAFASLEVMSGSLDSSLASLSLIHSFVDILLNFLCFVATMG